MAEFSPDSGDAGRRDRVRQGLRNGPAGSPADSFARLAVELYEAAQSGLGETADTLVQFVVQATGCDLAGILLKGRRSLTASAVSDPRIEAIYQLQIELDNGPAIHALAEGTHRRWR